MKKLIVIYFLFLLCPVAESGIVDFFTLLASGASAWQTWNCYKTEKNNTQPVGSQLELVKNVKNRTLQLTKKLSKEKEKAFSQFIETYAKPVENFEARCPETTKFGALTMALLIIYYILSRFLFFL